jgi:cathepsin D
LINANADFVNKLYSGIEGASRVPNSLRWTLPCDKIPTVVLTIAGRPFSIPPENFTPGRVEEGSPLCFGGIVANVEANEPWIVGGVFLSTVYTVFDAEKPRIGFAALKDDYDAQA